MGEKPPNPPSHSPPLTIPAADVPTNKVVWRQPDKDERTQIVSSWTINDFRSWLVAQGKTKMTVKETVNYTKRFASVLDTGDASPILNTIKPNVQHHALTALANLAKYTGRYQKFLEIRQRYNLKWSRGDPMIHFERFFNEGLTLDVMLQRIKEMIEILPVQMGKIIKFGCLVGLRASEVIESVRLLNSENVKNHVNGKNLQTQEISYYNPKRQALEHFRYKQFMRQTKKAYISFVTSEMLNIVQNLDKVPTKNAITHACQRQHISMDMYLTRKIFATWLRKEGIQPEVVDLLQGRVSQSVLTRHYLTSSGDLKDRILCSLDSLKQEIER
ncbi:MAG: hypothetical protein M3275_10885 [Thermoproteota archaeon]|nr:hypothetical protein [Thermoproteota archaeon]